MKKRSLLGTLLLIGLVPLFVSSISLIIISVSRQSSILQESTYQKLKSAAMGIANHYAKEIQTTGTATYDNQYIDSLKDQDIELTLFIEDTVYLTSITNPDTNERDEGAKAVSEVYKTVCSGKDFCQKGVVINGSPYYVYYTPIYSQNNTVVGIGFAGETEENVTNTIQRTIWGMIAISLLLMLAFTVLVVIFAIKIRKPISMVSESMNILASGKLTYNLNTKSVIKEIASLIDASDNLRINLSNIISQVNNNTNEMNQNMNEVAYGVENYTEVSSSVANAISELASGSVDMAESVQNCTLHMEKMGNQITSIRDLANNANQNADGVLSVCANAKTELVKLIEAISDTMSISDDVVNGIKHASDAAEKIRVAAEAITSIASETNLLSLNASIEAARAGEAGRGFAVVASNIQSLAQQSDDSAKEIQSIIESIIEISQTNVTLANSIKSAVDNEGAVLDEVSKTFDTVDDKVRDTAGAVSAIHDKVALLNSSKDNMIEEITTLSAISEENAASCQETNASMEELRANMETISSRSSDTRDVSTSLTDIVSYFSVEP